MILGLAGRLAGKEASKKRDRVEPRPGAGDDYRRPSLAELLAVRLASGGGCGFDDEHFRGSSLLYHILPDAAFTSPYGRVKNVN
jgi:hypothetical protein